MCGIVGYIGKNKKAKDKKESPVRMMWSPILGQRIGDHLYGT